MADIITRETGVDAKNAPLTNEEVDNNFINLKAEAESKEEAGVAASLDAQHLLDFEHGDIAHANRAHLDSIDQALSTTDEVQFNSASLKHAHFDPISGLLPYQEGTIGYDPVNKCLAVFNDQSEVTWQLGRENFMRIKNGTGSTLLNGRAVAVIAVSDVPEVGYATSFDDTSLNTVGILTHDVAPGAYGEVTVLGFVNGLDTSALTAGLVIWLSDDFPATGLLTTTKPNSPSYATEMGGVAVSDPVNGVLYSRMIPRDNKEGLTDFYNGAILEDHSISITTNGVDSVSLSLTNSGSDFLSLLHHGEFHKFNVPSSVELTYGTDTSPVLNYVYIPESTETLTAVVAVEFPAVEQITPIATVLVQSPSNVAVNGCYKVHAWTDHITDSIGQGHLSHVNRWIRKQHATWVDGTLMAFSGSGTGTVEASITSGHVLQLHQHEFPARVTPADFFVINDFVNPYIKKTNLAAILQDSVGGTLANKSFSLVFWGVVNQENDDCKIICNLPSGSYASSKPEEAAADTQKYTNYTIPESYRGTGFLLRRLVCSFNPAGTALTFFEGVYDGDDLRGQDPNIVAGGGGFGGGGANIPLGGAEGQHLEKQSAIDYDTYWSNRLLNKTIWGATEKISPEVVTGVSPNFAFNIDMTYNRHAIDLSSLVSGDTITYTVTNPKSPGEGVNSMVHKIDTGADVTYTTVYPTGFTTPTLNADTETHVVFETWDDGTTWREFISGEF